MMRLFLILMFCGNLVSAEVLVATRIIPANTVISAEDIMFRDLNAAGASTDPALVIGMEARKSIFAGRPILASDVGVPAVVERNQVIELVFQGNGLRIKTDGRALDRAGPGDLVRVMNLSSRSIVMASIDERGVGFVRN
jgi:flagella basal body P-ring formation protein FlgA